MLFWGYFYDNTKPSIFKEGKVGTGWFDIIIEWRYCHFGIRWKII